MSFVTLNSPDPYQTLAERWLLLLTNTINAAGLNVPGRTGVVMVRPAEDCCPDLSVWLDNFRPYDFAFPNTLNEGRVLMHLGIAFDINVRIGLCYIESADDGQPMDIIQLALWTAEINKYIQAVYSQPIFDLATGCVEEFGLPATFLASNLTGYNLGGCAGYEYVLTVGLLT